MNPCRLSSGPSDLSAQSYHGLPRGARPSPLSVVFHSPRDPMAAGGCWEEVGAQSTPEDGSDGTYGWRRRTGRVSAGSGWADGRTLEPGPGEGPRPGAEAGSELTPRRGARTKKSPSPVPGPPPKSLVYRNGPLRRASGTFGQERTATSLRPAGGHPCRRGEARERRARGAGSREWGGHREWGCEGLG